MAGDRQQRYCHVCQKNVYNAGGMTRRRLERLLKGNRSVCLRIHRNDHGQIETLPSETPIGRLTRFAVLASTSFLAAGGLPLKAQAASGRADTSLIQIAQTPTVKKTLKVYVTDPANDGIANADLKVTNDVTRIVVAAGKSNSAGEYIQDLPSGAYSIEVQSPGFQTFVQNRVDLTSGTENVKLIDIQLQLGTTMGSVVMLNPEAHPNRLQDLKWHFLRLFHRI